MPKNFEDDDEIEVKKPTSKKASAKDFEDDDEISLKSKKAEPPAVVVSAEDDCEFGDQKLMYRGDGLDRLRPEKGAAVRFAIIPYLKPKKGNNHYIDKKGTYRCASSEEGEGACCKALGQPNLQIVAAVVHYTNAHGKTGKYAKEVEATEYEVKYVTLSRTNFSDISSLVQEDEKVDDFDIVMTHRENGIGYKFNRVSNEARWKKKGLATQVKETCAKYEDGVLLTKKLGKRLNPAEWKALISVIEAENGDESGSDDL